MEHFLNVLLVVTRVVHVGSAIVVVGGTAFFRYVLMPAADQSLNPGDHDRLRAEMLGKWRKVVHRSIILFLISGFINYFRAMPDHRGDAFYHAIVGSKIILAFVVFFVSMALVGQSPRLEFIRASRAKWLSINLLLAFVIIVMSGILKVKYGYSLPATSPELPATSTGS